MVKEVLAYLETHWDREWYKTFEEYRLRLIDVMEDIFEKIETNNINCFYLDGQTIALDDYLEIYPEKVEYVKDLIKNKKLFVGPFYALADECLVNGESLARNLLIGISSSKKYNAKDFVGYLPDAFGHCAWMPMLFQKTGIKNAIVWRGVEKEFQEFIWQSPDKSEVQTTYLAAGYFQDFFAQKSYKKNILHLLRKLEQFSDKNPILLPIGADHLGCENNIKAKIKNFNRNNNDYHIKLSSLKEYYEKLANNNNLEIIKGELRCNQHSSILPSVFSSRVILKQHNMYSQWLLGKIAEPLYAINPNKLLPSRQNSFDYAWKTLIQNHAHDSICGCSLDEVHKENICRYEKVEQLCNTAIDIAKYNIASNIDSRELFVINLSNFNFSGVYSFYSEKKLPLPVTNKFKAFPIEISQNIHNIPVQENYQTYYEYLAYAENIPGLSLITITPKSKQKTTLKLTPKSIENNKIKLEIDSSGLLNITDKIKNKKYSNFLNLTDEGDIGDSYNFSPIRNDEKLYAQFVKSQVLESNNLRGKLRLIYSLKIPTHAINNQKRSSKKIKHNFFIDIQLCENSPRMDFKIDYENLSKDHILKLKFKLEKAITNVLSEDVFGTITRKFNPEYNYKALLPAQKGEEIDINTSCLQRFVSVQGITIFTKGLQEYEVENNNLNITMLRCFDRISRKNLDSRGTAAGPPLPTPDGQCLSKQKAEYALLFSDNLTEIFKEADFYYNPLVTSQGKAKVTTIKDYCYLDIPKELYLYNIKESENRNGKIAKIFNYTNTIQKLTINNHLEVLETNILEEIISNENLINKEISIQPNELKILFIK